MWNENQFNLTNNDSFKNEAQKVNSETGGSYQAQTSGAYGEFQLASIVGMLPSEYNIINNVLLNTTKYRKLRNGSTVKCGGDTSTQIDHVIVSPYGIFVVETKNYKGMIFGDCNGTVWTQVLNNKRHFTFYNPVKQNDGHIRNLSKQLKIRPDIMQGIIVFTNNESNRINVNCNFCITGEQLYMYLMSFRGRRILKDSAVYKIIERIDKVNQHGYINEHKHIDFVKRQKEKYEYNRDKKKGFYR